MTRRAYDSGAIEFKLWQLRDHADDAYRRVDDRPFGGGPGMVMLAEPLAARAGRRARRPRRRRRRVVHFTPTGRAADAGAWSSEFARGDGAVLLCARYEGVDQRFIDAMSTSKLSLGDYVLSGGEIAGAGRCSMRWRGCSRAC